MIRAFSFLRRDPQSGILSFRLRIPGHLQKLIGRTEIKRSLRTADKRLAIPVAYRLYAELQDYFKRLEKGESMQKSKGHKAKPKDDGFISKIVFDELTLPSGATAKGVTIDTGDDKKDVALAKELLGGIVATTPAVDSVKLLKVAAKYRAEKVAEGSWTQKTHDEHQALHELLSLVTGNVDIAAIGHKEARQFKETLLSLPANMGKSTYAGKSVRQLLQMNLAPAARMPREQLMRRYSGQVACFFGLFAMGNVAPRYCYNT